MPATLQRKRIRLEIFADKDDPIKDQLTAETPDLWRGNDVQFELGIKWDDRIADISNLASITLDLREDNVLGSLAATKTLAAAGFEFVTDETWADKTGQHGKLILTGTETNFDLGPGITEKRYWLVVSAITTDAPSRAITLGATILILREDGAGTAGIPPTNDPLYYTIPQTDAIFAKLAPADSNYRIFTDGNGTFFQFWNPDQSKWHSIWIAGAAGEERMNIGTGEA